MSPTIKILTTPYPPPTQPTFFILGMEPASSERVCPICEEKTCKLPDACAAIEEVERLCRESE